jgi:hypothetical protein
VHTPTSDPLALQVPVTMGDPVLVLSIVPRLPLVAGVQSGCRSTCRAETCGTLESRSPPVRSANCGRHRFHIDVVSLLILLAAPAM